MTTVTILGELGPDREKRHLTAPPQPPSARTAAPTRDRSPHSLPVPVGGPGGAARSWWGGGGRWEGGSGRGVGGEAEPGGFFSAVSTAAAAHECPRSDSSAMGRGVSRGSGGRGATRGGRSGGSVRLGSRPSTSGTRVSHGRPLGGPGPHVWNGATRDTEPRVSRPRGLQDARSGRRVAPTEPLGGPIPVGSHPRPAQTRT